MKKNIVIALLFSCFSLHSFSQQNYFKFSAGIGGGLTNSLTDVNEPKIKQVITGVIDYHFTPFITAGFEMQTGKISGSDSRNPYPFFVNSFSTYLFTGKFYLGQLTATNNGQYQDGALRNVVKGLYLSPGAGVIFNNQKEILRSFINEAGTTTTFYGVDKNHEFLISASIGIDYDLSERLILNANYKQHYTFGDNLDGYLVSGSRNDVYSTLTVGVKVRFGPLGIY